ncbi:MAG: hypothetical protein PWQ79_1209 [Thermococcaceae archaeon]|nr:hypothetical protein [Thermococcaceae archaeon]
MIGLIGGVLLGFVMAFILGRVKGRGYEVAMALFGMPVFTYAISIGLGEGWPKNTYLWAGTCLSPLKWAGIEVFLSFFVALLYFYLRARGSLSIDEYVQVSYLAPGTFAGAVVLSSTLLPALIVPGILAYALIVWPKEGSSIKFLKVERVDLLEGFEVYTDEKSMMVFRDGRKLFIGGATLKRFPRSRELAECTLMLPALCVAKKLAILAIGFLPAVALLFVPRGTLTIAAYGVVVLVTAQLLAKVTVKTTNKTLSKECREVVGEYSDFLRKKGKSEDAAG